MPMTYEQRNAIVHQVSNPYRVEIQDESGQWHALSLPTERDARQHVEFAFRERNAAWAIIIDQRNADPMLLGTHPAPGELIEEWGYPVR